MSCDEYPFASSEEAQLQPLPATGVASTRKSLDFERIVYNLIFGMTIGCVPASENSSKLFIPFPCLSSLNYRPRSSPFIKSKVQRLRSFTGALLMVPNMTWSS